MPKKPVKFGLKVWVLADARSKYVWNFEFYCRASSKVGEKSKDSGKGVGKQGGDVVKNLVKDLHHKGHLVVVDNFFTSVLLFTSLLDVGIFATGSARADRKGLPPCLINKMDNAKHEQGWSNCRMHNNSKVCCLVWNDKKPVLLLSTHALPTAGNGRLASVWRLVNGEKKKVPASPIHLQYAREIVNHRDGPPSR